jgi:L-asparaginase II
MYYQEQNMIDANPILAEVTRGTTVESRHRGAYAVFDVNGTCIAAAGNITIPVFPRSAVKAFQCYPLIESGAADRFQLNDEEIALCCSSHNGEAEHVRVARAILQKAGIAEATYECGEQWPERLPDKLAIGKDGKPGAVHNNCSGKHAGMLAYAKHIDAPLQGYSKLEHPVQRAVAQALDQFCHANTTSAPMGIDGCSVPTWAMPLENLAQGFARLFASDVGQRIAKAVRNNPFMVAGTGRFDTKVMEAVPRLFIKVGAEGVFCGAVPDAGIGFALKVDDGAFRGAEVAVAKMLSQLACWSHDEKQALLGFTHATLRNWRKLEVGENRASF